MSSSSYSSFSSSTALNLTVEGVQKQQQMMEIEEKKKELHEQVDAMIDMKIKQLRGEYCEEYSHELNTFEKMLNDVAKLKLKSQQEESANADKSNHHQQQSSSSSSSPMDVIKEAGGGVHVVVMDPLVQPLQADHLEVPTMPVQGVQPDLPPPVVHLDQQAQQEDAAVAAQPVIQQQQQQAQPIQQVVVPPQNVAALQLPQQPQFIDLETVRGWFIERQEQKTIKKPGYVYEYCFRITPLHYRLIASMTECDAFKQHVRNALIQHTNVEQNVIDQLINDVAIHWNAKPTRNMKRRDTYNACMFVSGVNLTAMAQLYRFLFGVHKHGDGMQYDGRQLIVSFANYMSEF